jgi:hypothetical protein
LSALHASIRGYRPSFADGTTSRRPLLSMFR